MPYILEPRTNLTHAAALGVASADSVGKLTYLLTAICAEYLRQQSSLRYQSIAEAVAALECTKLELYRRIGAPYEERMKQTNGDVESLACLLRERILLGGKTLDDLPD